MAHLYEVASPQVVLSAAGPVCTILAGAACCEIREIGVWAAAFTTASDVQAGRPAANGTGAATGTLVQQTDGNDAAGQAQIVTSFATLQPTVPTVPLRQTRLVAAAGSGFIWVWDPGELILMPSGQLVIWMTVAGSITFDVYAKVAE